MVKLPAGSFIAGSLPTETAASSGLSPAYTAREQPARKITVARGFAIGRTEVTRAAFATFVAATGWRPDGPCSFLADGPTNRWADDNRHDWANPGFVQTDAHPVVCVNLADAQVYADWLSVRTQRRFRLPSNAEWEYAARAGTGTARWWDSNVTDTVCTYANISDISRANAHNNGKVDAATFTPCDDGYAETAPVASYRSNPWGLYDMIGNVWEWTLDCLNPDQVGAPSDVSPRRSGDCGSHIDRGASWSNSPKYVRTAVQHPDLVHARTTVLGFRLVEDLP